MLDLRAGSLASRMGPITYARLCTTNRLPPNQYSVLFRTAKQVFFRSKVLLSRDSDCVGFFGFFVQEHSECRLEELLFQAARLGFLLQMLKMQVVGRPAARRDRWAQ